MNKMNLQNALSNVDDKYIAEAASYRKTSGSLKVWRAIAIAACCVIALPLTIIAGMALSDAVSSSGGKSASAGSEYYYAETYAETTAAANYYQAGGGYTGDAAAAEAYEYEAAEEYFAGDYYESDDSYDSGSGYSSEKSSSITSSDAKIIRTAEIEMQSTEYPDAIDAIDALVKEYGAYYESKNLSDGKGYRSANLSIRIPAENYEKLIEGIRQAGTVTSLYENTDDVSDSYYDIETRLESARTKLSRLQELLSKAEDMSDIITIEEAISDTELEIDYLQGSLKGYDSRISYSTVYVYLHEVYKVENNETPATFSERFSLAFRNGLESFGESMGDIAIWFAESWIWLLIVAVIIAAAVIVPIVCVRTARRRRMR